MKIYEYQKKLIENTCEDCELSSIVIPMIENKILLYRRLLNKWLFNEAYENINRYFTSLYVKVFGDTASETLPLDKVLDIINKLIRISEEKKEFYSSYFKFLGGVLLQSKEEKSMINDKKLEIANEIEKCAYDCKFFLKRLREVKQEAERIRDFTKYQKGKRNVSFCTHIDYVSASRSREQKKYQMGCSNFY